MVCKYHSWKWYWSFFLGLNMLYWRLGFTDQQKHHCRTSSYIIFSSNKSFFSNERSKISWNLSKRLGFFISWISFFLKVVDFLFFVPSFWLNLSGSVTKALVSRLVILSRDVLHTWLCKGTEIYAKWKWSKCCGKWVSNKSFDCHVINVHWGLKYSWIS